MSATKIEQLLSNETIALHELVKELIVFEDLYSFFRNNSARRDAVLAHVQRTVDAYNAGDADARYTLHRSLSYIYETSLYIPDKKPVYNQNDPILVEIQRELEAAWEAFEEARMPELNDVPEDPKEFERWLRHFVLNHYVADHPLYEYLENDATFEEMREFMSEEITVDTRFDDLVAFAQVGTDGTIKMELAENYWDEMGNGKMEEVHTVMFNHLLEELNLTNQDTLLNLMEGASWEALACGNALLNNVLYRKNVYKALGSLGALEMMSPKRFDRLVGGYKRLGLSEQAAMYHSLHVAIDTRHGNGWLRNAVVPFVAADKDIRWEIIKGAFYRLHTSLDYADRLYKRFTENKELVNA
ncbi:iron-containing redox enzyme family protein [Tumebacillus sp. DT12]|uniref:Iron-containing redox enzyme family protein n=1 Tax=Tumebacillus lacus TaxID=2995335 RepID=A0ABT3WX11_9BACL|nr:iron-containing redox enzyme family protein [Tumebacillus lacus]MCX7569218.1 iron-containing redox enzyme family protein [Tumebacillus lacus]